MKVMQFYHCMQNSKVSLIARFVGPTWGPSGADRTQVGPMLAHGLCYLGLHHARLLTHYPTRMVVTFCNTKLHRDYFMMPPRVVYILTCIEWYYQYIVDRVVSPTYYTKQRLCHTDHDFGSSAAEVPAKFQSDRTIQNTNLASSRIHQILR